VAQRLPVELLNVTADEVWIIAKPETQVVAPGEDSPGSGVMLAKLAEEEKEIPLPLKHTDVQGQISGYIATVEVTQQFHNPYDEKIEAVYVFPLPQNAAINEFIMTIGERRIRGIIRERKEAERIYRQARDQGYVASLLTQERPNIFTQKVANIEPGKEIDVNIKYFNTLAYVDGWYEFVFPMVVGPRFNPPGYTDGVGAVGRGKAGISGQKTEVQYLKPGERSGHDISLAVDIDAGVAIEEVVCLSHVVTNSSPASEARTITLSPRDSIPNKDFVLRYKVAGRTVKSALVTHHDERGGFFTLMLYPPENLNHLRRAPMEMIFVLDCSGSMSGKPIAKAKDAIKRAPTTLRSSAPTPCPPRPRTFNEVSTTSSHWRGAAAL
jgi:Ca-activated chloride channel family protein